VRVEETRFVAVQHCLFTRWICEAEDSMTILTSATRQERRLKTAEGRQGREKGREKKGQKLTQAPY
jgi:hypothetical protein